MHRRLLALVLALFIAGAPQALALCHIACATAGTNGTGGEGHEGHSCPHRSMPTTAVLHANPHVCGHVNELPKAEGQPQVSAPVAIVATELATRLSPETSPPLAVAIQQSPPALLAAPLRI